MGAPRWPPNPPTFGTSRQSRDVPLSRALAWPPSRIYLHGGREMAPKPDLFIWGPKWPPNPQTFGASRQSRDASLSRSSKLRGGGDACDDKASSVASFDAARRPRVL